MKVLRQILIISSAIGALLVGLLFAIEAYGAEDFRYKCDGTFVDHLAEEQSAISAFFILRKYGLPNRIGSHQYGTLTIDIPHGIASVHHTYNIIVGTDDLLFITDVGDRTSVRGDWSWVSRGIFIRLTDQSYFEGICAKDNDQW